MNTLLYADIELDECILSHDMIVMCAPLYGGSDGGVFVCVLLCVCVLLYLSD